MKSMMFCILFGFNVFVITHAESVVELYIVQPGDTLWKIAKRHLKNPNDWRQLVREDGSELNPTTLRPGDVLRMQQQGNQTMAGSMKVSGTSNYDYAPRQQPTNSQFTSTQQRYNPKYSTKPGHAGLNTRNEPFSSIPSAPINKAKMAKLIKDSSIVDDRDNLEKFTVVVSGHNGRTLGKRGNIIYAQKRSKEQDTSVYDIYRDKGNVNDPATDDNLGVVLLHIGEAKFMDIQGDIITLVITKSTAAIKPGDFLTPGSMPRALNVIPAQIKTNKSMRIIGSVDKGVLLSINDSVIINKGYKDDVSIGQLFVVARGNYISNFDGEKIMMPELKIGLLVIYNVGKRMSFGVVTESKEVIEAGDYLASP